MVLDDTLNRLPNLENHSDIELNECIVVVNTEIEDPKQNTVAIINVFPEKQNGLALKLQRILSSMH